MRGMLQNERPNNMWLEHLLPRGSFKNQTTVDVWVNALMNQGWNHFQIARLRWSNMIGLHRNVVIVFCLATLSFGCEIVRCFHGPNLCFFFDTGIFVGCGNVRLGWRLGWWWWWCSCFCIIFNHGNNDEEIHMMKMIVMLMVIVTGGY